MRSTRRNSFRFGVDTHHPPSTAQISTSKILLYRQEKPLKYFLVIRTHPDHLLPRAAVLSLREALRTISGSSDLCEMSGPADADIDAETLADMIAEGRFAESEFVAYCDSNNTYVRRSDGEFNHLAAQAFLKIKRGQEIMSLFLPFDESAPAVYAALVEFARERNLRLWCPMPYVQGDIDLEHPGQLPPYWDIFIDRFRNRS